MFISWVISSGAKHQPTFSVARVGTIVHFSWVVPEHNSLKIFYPTVCAWHSSHQKKKKSRQHFFFVNSYQYNLRNEWLRSKEKIETEPFVTVCTSKYSGLDNVWAGEYISLYPLVTHSAMKCSNTIWMDTLWRVDCKKPCPYWHNIEDKLLGSTSRISYTHMSTVMEFAINIFGFLPT